MKCENCNNPATVHLTEIKSGKKIEKHLCESCAQQLEGIGSAKGHMPINELLTNFVMAHSGVAKIRTGPEPSDIALFVMAAIGVWLARRAMLRRAARRRED